MNHVFRSTWGALLWKEWRQQRLAFLAFAGLCLAIYLGYDKISGGKPNIRGAFVLLVLAATFLGANAFAAEQDDRSEAFLASLPSPLWRRLLVKYLMVVPLALLCLVLPLAMTQSVVGSDANALFRWGTKLGLRVVMGWRIAEGAASLAVVAIFLLTASVSLTCALARRGLGGLATLLLGLALWSAHAVFLGWVAREFLYGFEHAGLGWGRYLLMAVGFTWVVIQFGALRSCFRRSELPGGLWRRLGSWLVVVCLAPVLAFPALVAHQFLFVSPVEYATQNTGWSGGGVHAVPSPDGRSIAISATPNANAFLALSATWLMDVGSGKIRRTGTPWGSSRLYDPSDDWQERPPHGCFAPGAWSSRLYPPGDGRQGWSPDGSHLLLEVSGDSPLEWFRGLRAPRSEELARPELWSLRVEQGKATVMDRSPTSVSSIQGWLGDGTRAAQTKDGWEFRDESTGNRRLCRDPAPGASPSGSWSHGRTFWLDRAIVTVHAGERFDGERADGRLFCLLWQYTPQSDNARRIDIPLADKPQGFPYPVDVSRDGKWLLVARSSRGEPPWRLVSLADGANQILLPPDPGRCQGAFFTSDSSRLVVVGTHSLRVRNLAEQRPESHLSLPEPLCTPRQPKDPSGHSYVASPGLPYRVAASAPGMNVFILNTGAGTIAHVAATSDPAISGQPNVSWLGNDRLLIEHPHPYRLWVAEADGSGSRQVLP
jgi:hypothetical protein